MNPMLEPFLYETAAQRQSELRASARAVGRPSVLRAPSPFCVRLRWRSAGDRVTVGPCAWRLLGWTR